jgi:hypothetical protein
MGGYDEMTVPELKDEARSRNMEGFSQLNKAELIASLEADDKEQGGDMAEKKEGTRGAEGEIPRTGYEGGVVEEGTGDFAPGSSAEGDVVIEEGVLGGPVSPQNPPAKALLGGGRPNESEDNEFAEATAPQSAKIAKEQANT